MDNSNTAYKTKKLYRIFRTVPKSRRHLRLLRGQMKKAISHMSEPLQDSVIRTWERQLPKGLPY